MRVGTREVLFPKGGISNEYSLCSLELAWGLQIAEMITDPSVFTVSARELGVLRISNCEWILRLKSRCLLLSLVFS